MMERSLSHKSDGRHSSAGHSVHSHHSLASGRASSLGLDTNFATGDDDSSSFEMPEPPVSLYVLGTVPSIVRCWLTTHYTHDTLLYADICTGSQKSTVDYSLIKELELVDDLERDVDGILRARLNVYLAEAVVTQHNARARAPVGSVPSVTVSFEVTGVDQPGQMGERKAIRIYIGSDALRTYSADVLFSRNKMILFGNERDRLQVPFVRPEDDSTFRHICTANMIPERPKLNANALPFVLAGRGMGNGEMAGDDPLVPQQEDDDARRSLSPLGTHVESHKPPLAGESTVHGGEGDKLSRDTNGLASNGRDGSNVSDRSRRESSAMTSSGIWSSWRQGAASGTDGLPLSGYQPAARGGRSMKVLRSHKSGSMSARVGASFETPLPSKSSDGRRKSQAGAGGEGGSAVNAANRREAKRTPSLGAEARPPASRRDSRSAGTLPRSANPVGVASAFSWMTPPGKAPKASATNGGD